MRRDEMAWTYDGSVYTDHGIQASQRDGEWEKNQGMLFQIILELAHLLLIGPTS